MSLSDRRKKVQQEREQLTQLKVERARAAAESVVKSDQFKLSALAMPDAAMAVDALVQNVVTACTDPIGEYMDTLSAKGFRTGEIRALTHQLYDTYCIGIGHKSDPDMLFEDMVGPVANFMLAHQELYNTLDPESMRQ